MKIECTQKQKDILIAILTGEENLCPFINGICYGFGYCNKCMEEKIEWTITDET